jgi:glycosyltransferase involved in cell wall biosynthesis
MKLLIVADVYMPSTLSAAIELRDLATEMVAQGHDVTVLAPMVGGLRPFAAEQDEHVRIVRVRAPRTKDVNLIRRALAEICLPFALLRGMRLSGLKGEHWDGVVWYSPTIFLGLVARCVKRWNQCRGYLIVRDLFPDWAVDAGVMRKGFAYRFFKAVERFQYRVADVIGVQTPANVALVARDAPSSAEIEVLYNWMRMAEVVKPESGKFDLGNLEGRTLFVYAGNMGKAQDMDAFLELAARLRSRLDLGFLFVGRGSEVSRLQQKAGKRELTNVRFMSEIDSALIPALFEQCHVGIVALDPRHKTHNIPGKFMAYARNGLPVLARINPGNDLAHVIRDNNVGYGVEGDSITDLQIAAERLADHAAARIEMGKAGRKLADRLFSPAAAAKQVVRALARADSKPISAGDD